MASNPAWQNLRTRFSLFPVPKKNYFQQYQSIPRFSCIFGIPPTILWDFPLKNFAEKPVWHVLNSIICLWALYPRKKTTGLNIRKYNRFVEVLTSIAIIYEYQRYKFLIYRTLKFAERIFENIHTQVKLIICLTKTNNVFL